MEEEIVKTAQKFMDFYSTQWSILANLFHASSVLHNLQSESKDLNLELEKAHGEIQEAISLTISAFNTIISQIGEYRDITPDAFAFLTDDLERTIGFSEQIAKTVDEGFTEAVKDGIVILKAKLKEISEKVDSHLRRKTEA